MSFLSLRVPRNPQESLRLTRDAGTHVRYHFVEQDSNPVVATFRDRIGILTHEIFTNRTTSDY